MVTYLTSINSNGSHCSFSIWRLPASRRTRFLDLRQPKHQQPIWITSLGLPSASRRGFSMSLMHRQQESRSSRSLTRAFNTGKSGSPKLCTILASFKKQWRKLAMSEKNLFLTHLGIMKSYAHNLRPSAKFHLQSVPSLELARTGVYQMNRLLSEMGQR